MNTRTRILIMVEGALMIALAFVLSLVKLELWLQGGSITLLSMLPLILFSYRRGPARGLLVAFVFSLLKLLLGFHNVMYCPTLASQILCVLLDYVVAYSVIGLAGLFGRLIAKPDETRRGRIVFAVAFGVVTVFLLRFAAAFTSGIVLWGAYAPEGQPVWLYSLIYNGGYLAAEAALTLVGSMILIPLLPKAPKTAE